MQKSKTKNTSAIIKDSFINNKNQSKLSIDLGIYISVQDHCEHLYTCRRQRVLTCAYCNLINSLASFYIKNKCVLSRLSISSILNCDFDTFYRNSLYLSSFDSDVENAPSYRVSCKHASTLSRMLGINSQNSDNYNSRDLCNYAEHIFECASFSDSAHGRLFPICGESNSWHATCAQCGASCEFATARSQSLIALLLHFCRLRIVEKRVYISCLNSDDWTVISEHTCLIVLKVLGATSDVFTKLGKLDEPIHPHTYSNIPDSIEGATFGVLQACRFARIDVKGAFTECNHNFVLSSCEGHSIILSDDMLRLFMMLLPGSGYLFGEVNGCNVDSLCGIMSIGGLMGVNVKCNSKFVQFHRDFYSGNFYADNMHSDEFYDRTKCAISKVEFTCQAQMAHYNEYREIVHSSDNEGEIEEEQKEDDEESEVDEESLDYKFQQFMKNEEELFEIEVPRTQGRGLKQRVGGLLRGIANCVKKLHAVWDYPLDVAVNIADKTGAWMEQNSEHVDKDVWSCTMCEQLSKDLASMSKSQEQGVEMIREAVKRLAGAVDGATRNVSENLTQIEGRLSKLENDILEGKGYLDDGALRNLEERLKKMVGMASVNAIKNDDKLAERILENTNNITKLLDMLANAKSVPNKSKYKGVQDFGEQLPVPRNAVKQSGIVETEFVNPETEHSFEEISNLVRASGVDDLHNAVGARHLVSSFDWTVSSGEGKILSDVVLPNAIFEKNKRMANFSSYFQYYTCDALEFEITTTSIAMQGGTLMVAWDSMSSASRQKISSVMQLSGLPNVYIHASSSSLTTFTVSSSSIQHMMCLSGSESSIGLLGTLKICCINVLNAPAEASQKVAVRVWVKFVNPRFSFYTAKHELVYSQSGVAKRLERDLESLEAIVAVGKWSTTSGVNLNELIVHPTSSNVDNGLVTQTPLSVVSHVFARWRGSLVFKFVFGASAFVKGKIMVSAIPVQFRTERLSINEMTGFPNIICDLSGESREFDFEVPYHSIGRNSLVCRNALFDSSNYDAQLVVTRLHALVLDGLVMNANASNSVSYVVTLRPGKDFELLEPHGVHAENVGRIIAQNSFMRSFQCSRIIGQGFSDLCQTLSLLRVFTLDDKGKNIMSFFVSPTYRSLPPCATLLSWLAQLFVQWRGEIVYELRAHSFNKTKGCFVRVWYEPNGSTLSGDDFEYLSGNDPPSGAKVHYWDPSTGPFRIVVPFCARTEKLMVQKTRYELNGAEWLQSFNGCLYVDYEGDSSIVVALHIAGGSSFELFERTVAPKCGDVSEAFTKLTYAKQLMDITKKPMFDREVLRGPFAEATVEPVRFKPVEGVNKGKVAPRDVSEDEGPEEGDTDETEGGRPIIYRGGKWHFADAVKQMDCCLPFAAVRNGSKIVQDMSRQNVCGKVNELLESAIKIKDQFAEAGTETTVSDLTQAVHLLLPLLKKVGGISDSIETNVGVLDKVRTKVMAILMPLIKSSIPGLIQNTIEKEQYAWATIITLIGGAALWWTCSKVKGFVKKFSILCMIIWSPFLLGKVWDLGAWIKTKWNPSSKIDETCRKHSMAGLFEGAEKLGSSFTTWFSGNWSSVIQSLLSVLGVVASLVIWGIIPDAKKLGSFSAIFKEVGEKGKTISQICSGFNSINKLVGEWSAKFTQWILSNVCGAMPNADSALQQLVTFSIRDWVTEVRDFALLENRFTGFGCEGHLEKVRRMYDKSCVIQEKLIDGCKVDVQLGLILKDCKEKCTELLNESYTFKGMKQPRVDPIHVCLIGGPGVGKSTLTHVLINDMLDYQGEPEVDRIYTRCCADAYWSNYHQEPVILYDDLGAIKSSLKLSDYAEIMGIKTNDPFSVPMAGVNEKGRHCTSKYVFSCTNVLELDDSGDVVTKNAFYRRRNILVEVERDSDVLRCEEDPTKGLLFTVLGHNFTGNDGAGIEFYIKDQWHESFLSEVDTSSWYFERVDYATFLDFANTYTSAYMSSQEKLLKGLHRRRSAIARNEEMCVAQMGETTVSLTNIIELFNEKQITGRQLCDNFSKGVVLPDKWHTNKIMTFHDFISSLCCCSVGDSPCDFDYRFKRMFEDIKGQGKSFYSQFKFRTMAKDAEHVLFKCCGEFNAESLSALNMAHVLMCLITYFRWTIDLVPGVCHFRMSQIKEKIVLDASDLNFDDRIDGQASFSKAQGFNVVSWPSVGKFFPEAISKFNCVGLKYGHDIFALVPDVFNFKRGVDDVLASAAFVRLNGLEVSLPVRELLQPKIKDVAGLMFRSVVGWPVEGEDFEKHVSDAKEILGYNNHFITYLLCYTCQAHEHHNIVRARDLLATDLKSFSTKCDGIIEYEKKIASKLSGPVKIGLAIAGGIVCLGSLVGLCLGIKTTIDSLMGSFSGKERNDEVEEVTIEEAEKEISAASASSAFTTNHHRRMRITPKIRNVEKGEKHVSGAHASDSLTTEHVMTKRIRPKSRLVPEQGFGVTYSDTDIVRSPVIQKRKSARKEFLNAIKQTKTKGTRSNSTIIRNVSTWQNSVVKRGFESGAHFAVTDVTPSDSFFSNENFKPENDFTSGNQQFEVSDRVLDVLRKQMSDNHKRVAEVIEKGAPGTIHKQVRVGALGVERDPNMVTLLQTHISKMSCVVLNTTRNSQCNVLRLRGSMILFPAHYLEEFHEEDEFYFISPNKVVRVYLEPSRVTLVNDCQDLAIWDLGNSVPPSTDFTGHIPTVADWKHYADGSGALSLTRYDSKCIIQTVHMLESVERIKADTNVPSGSYEMFDSTHTILMGLRYRIHCMSGFCGAAILRADARQVRKIVGIHVAGHTEKGIGYAEMLVLEPILAAMEKLCVDASRVLDGRNLDESPVELVSKQCDSFEGCGNLGMRGIVSKREIPTIPTRTTICKSFLHGLIGKVQTEPSILSKFDRRLGDKRGVWDPVLDAVAKYGTDTFPFPEDEIKIVEEHLSGVFSNFRNSLGKREVNSLEVGINGIDLTDFWSPIEMKTSSGWPYCKRKPAGASGKSWMFEQVGTYSSGRPIYTFKDEGLIESYECMLQQSKEGIPPCVVTMECPKDERRKLSKIYDKPATRTFTILPPEVNILFRQYFGDFAAMIMSSRGFSFCQVGINPETLEWSDLMNSFLRISNKGFAGDYAKFDGISPASIYHSIVNVVNNWYNDGAENARVRHSLLSSIVHRNGIAGEYLLQYSQGMPSGFAMTVIFNSLVNYYFMSLAWMNLVSKSELSPQSDLRSFDRYCRIIVYGDDNVVAVDEEFLPIYNLRTVAGYLSEYGVTYTDDAKNPIHLSEPFVDITSVTFLKRNFTRVATKGWKAGSLWKACLDKVSIEERCNWIRDCDDPEEALAQNVEGALFEASIWGEEYFTDLHTRLSSAYDRVQLTMPSHTFSENNRRWWSSMTGAQPSLLNISKIEKLSRLNQIDLTHKVKDVLVGKDKTLLEMLREATQIRGMPLEV
ncbi:TPA_asm: polyprotein [Pedicularis rex waikavirus]|uniref:Genome polyprotein n=1 Tax=Pedicularis rex waikavirus TaxID=3027345 RepID=A0AA48SKD7_9SECO|nr:TPA_asm: polyprotein [Pedicularis rex waikavirus]